MTAFLALSGAPRAEDGFRETPEAVQTVYRDGVPHTTRQGAERLAYDPDVSFFPIALYNGLAGRHADGDHDGDFALYAAAGFNSVFPWRDQSLDAVLAAARANGLQVVVRDPTDAELRRLAADPAVIGYDLDHEPSVHAQEETAAWRLDWFRARRASVRGLDPERPVFTVDAPAITPPYRNAWLAWAAEGDLIAFWKYPFFRAPVVTLAGPRGVPEVTALAVETGKGRKPVWYVAQAFRSPINRWFMPDEAQARAMVYAGLIHGATGIVWFTHDSYVSRNGRVIGASPDPKADYGATREGRRERAPPLVATRQQLEQSRRMWRAVERLNAELAALRATILSPTAARAYRVAVRGRSVSPTPIRTLLKQTQDGLVLLAVNIDAKPLEVRFSFESPIEAATPFFGGRPAPEPRDGIWTEQIEPWGVRVYRIRG